MTDKENARKKSATGVEEDLKKRLKTILRAKQACKAGIRSRCQIFHSPITVNSRYDNVLLVFYHNLREPCGLQANQMWAMPLSYAVPSQACLLICHANVLCLYVHPKLYIHMQREKDTHLHIASHGATRNIPNAYKVADLCW